MGLRKPIPKPETLAEMTADATATTSDILYGFTAYTNGNKINGSHVCTPTEFELSVENSVSASRNEKNKNVSKTFDFIPKFILLRLCFDGKVNTYLYYNNTFYTKDVVCVATTYLINFSLDGNTLNFDIINTTGLSVNVYYYACGI